MIILDTNVLSELMKVDPNANVVRWVKQFSITSLFTTTITQAEILYGIALLPDGKRKSGFINACQTLFTEKFENRILPFDSIASIAFAEIASSRRKNGNPISQHDAQIAAIAHSRHSDLATRNVSDFEECGLNIINPWD